MTINRTVKRTVVISLLIYVLPFFSFSQKDSTVKFRNNAVYAELLGNMGGLYSINYERKIYEHKNGFFTARLGFNVAPGIYGNGFGGAGAGPLLINHIFFKKNHHLELGAGVRLPAGVSRNRFSEKLKWSWDNSLLAATACFMYRYQKPGGRFLFRLGYTPIYEFNDQDRSIAYYVNFLFFGIGAGYNF